MKYFLLSFFLILSCFANAQKISVYKGRQSNIVDISKDLSNFRFSQSQIINFGLTDSSCVIMITENVSSQIMVSVDNPTIDSVSFFSVYHKNVNPLKMEDLGYSKVLENNLGFDTILVRVKSSTQLVIPLSFNFRKNIVSNNNEIENFFFSLSG